MKIQRNFLIQCLAVLMATVCILFSSGCNSGSESQMDRSDADFKNAEQAVQLLNNVGRTGDRSGIYIEKLDEGYRIYFGEGLEENLESLCENYSKSGEGELLTADNVKSAFAEGVQQTVNDLISDDASTNVIYQFFKWCGTPCIDSAVYCGGTTYDQEECEKWISSGNLRNYNVVAGQKSCDEKGMPYDIKFKWQ